MDLKASVQQQFGSVAANYVTSSVHAGGPDLTAMIEAITLRGNERVLDAGCGTGHTALAFAPQVASVVGVDLTEEMLEQARFLAQQRKLDNVSFVAGDVELLPYPDNSFDVVTTRYSAHHYPHPQRALREFRRVLVPSGALLLVDVVAPEQPAADTFLNAIELLRDPSHVRDHTIDQWLAMLQSVGFQGQVRGTWSLRLDFDAWVRRMQTPAASVAQIKTLMNGAPSEVRDAFDLEGDNSFTVPTALLHGGA